MKFAIALTVFVLALASSTAAPSPYFGDWLLDTASSLGKNLNAFKNYVTGQAEQKVELFGENAKELENYLGEQWIEAQKNWEKLSAKFVEESKKLKAQVGVDVKNKIEEAKNLAAKWAEKAQEAAQEAKGKLAEAEKQIANGVEQLKKKIDQAVADSKVKFSEAKEYKKELETSAKDFLSKFGTALSQQAQQYIKETSIWSEEVKGNVEKALQNGESNAKNVLKTLHSKAEELRAKLSQLAQNNEFKFDGALNSLHEGFGKLQAELSQRWENIKNSFNHKSEAQPEAIPAEEDAKTVQSPAEPEVSPVENAPADAEIEQTAAVKEAIEASA